jgi:DNA topoisomerase III
MEGSTKYLVPSTLGIGLIEGYNKIGFEKSLSKPQLRREVSSAQYLLSPFTFHVTFLIIQTERCMVRVCQGTTTKHQMLAESIEQYKEVFVRARTQFEKVVAVRV